MHFIGFIRIITGEFNEYYEINDDPSYMNIGNPQDFPPPNFRFHIGIHKDNLLRKGDIVNYTSLHSFYWLKKIMDNFMISYITNEHFTSDKVDIWII